MGLYNLFSKEGKKKLKLASWIWKAFWPFIFSYSFLLSQKYLNQSRPRVLKFDVWEESDKERYETRQITPLIVKFFRPKKITYIDIDSALVKKAKKIITEKKYEIVKGDITHMPFKRESFDLVVDFSTTDHLSEKEFASSLKETYHVLRKGGLYLLYHLNSEYFNIKEWNKSYSMGLIPSFPRELNKIIHQLRKNGFEILHCFYFFPFLLDVTLRWFYFFSRHQTLFNLLPIKIKYFFFNSSNFNLFFFILTRKK